MFVNDIIVSKSKRGQGIGRELIEKAEIFAKRLGGHKMYLVTGKDWESRKFYEALGFAATGEFKKHFRKKDFVIYEKLV